MGVDHSAYVAYGVRIPVNPDHYDENGRSPGEQVDQALSVPTVKASCPDVGHLQAGGYGRDKFFLVTKCKEAGYEPAFVQDLSDSTKNQELIWDRQLMHLIEVMGWGGLADSFTIGWFVIADVS